jgi:mRNA interferase RelE/StbE
MTRTATKEIQCLPPIAAKEIASKIVQCFSDRTLDNADIKKLKGGHRSEYRLRVGKYRVMYRLEEDVAIVEHVLHRKEAYRKS